MIHRALKLASMLMLLPVSQKRSAATGGSHAMHIVEFEIDADAEKVGNALCIGAHVLDAGACGAVDREEGAHAARSEPVWRVDAACSAVSSTSLSRTFASVSGQSRLPFRTSRTKWGSLIAFRPKVISVIPALATNASISARSSG